MLILVLARIRANTKEVELMQLLDLHLGKPLTRGALTLFPVWNGSAVARPAHDLRRPRLTVSERAGSPVVGELVVHDAVAVPSNPTPSQSTPGRRARRFLERLAGASPYQRREAGLGMQTSASSPAADLTTVTWDDALVHAVAVNRRHELVAA